MKHLFVDNFRGFRNAWIPITHVNFLVGENSSGKTSILGLLKLLSSASFFFGHSFTDPYVSFGHFSDMVSAHSEDQSYFRIGLVWEERHKKKEGSIARGWLLTYVEANGIPRLYRYTYCRGATTVSLRFIKNAVYFKRSEERSAPTAQEIVARLLPRWAEEQANNSTSGYEALTLPPGFPKRIPLLVALSLIAGNFDPVGGKKRSKATEIIIGDPEEIAFAPGLVWVAPIRMKPKRTYDELPEFSPEGEHTPYLIRKMLRSRKEAIAFRSFMERVGKASGLFQDVRIRNFGRGSENPFEVDIVLDGKALNLINVGYGVSQSLPVLVEVMARPHNTWFAIQQPEVHLHPRAQAALGDVIFEMAAIEHKGFLIETHSDFTIDRFRMNYRNKAKRQKPESQILFFERKDKHNVVTPLPISDTGDLPSDQPNSYRDFFIREQMSLLGI